MLRSCSVDGLAQPRDALAILVGVGLLLGQRRRRAVAVRGARLGEQALLGGELVAEHLAAHVVAAALRRGVDARKAARRRRRRNRRARRCGGTRARRRLGGARRGVGHVEVRERARRRVALVRACLRPRRAC